jgi:hypothetical protein
MTDEIKEAIDSIVGKFVTLGIRLGNFDIRLHGELSKTDDGYYVEVEPLKTYALFSHRDIHHVDVEMPYVGTRFSKGFIEWLPVEADEWKDEIIVDTH